MKRLGYRKSRKGCARCKQRKVKCDEKVPCGACVKHEMLCSLERPTSSSLQPPRRGRVHINNGLGLKSSLPQRNSEPKQRASTSHLFSYFSHFHFDKDPKHAPSWFSDFELMHHYTAVAHRAFSSACLHISQPLQIDVPQEAFSHPFLLHQLLAFAAVHLAYLHPNSRHRYLIQASQHQGIAISGTTALLQEPIDPNSCHALYVTSAFITITAFGTFPSCDRYNDTFQTIDSLVDIFVLIHGMNVILHSSEELLHTGPLRRLLNGCSCTRPSQRSYAQEVASKLNGFMALLEERKTSIGQETYQALKEATVEFITAISRTSSCHTRMMTLPELRVIFGWPINIPTTYLALLRTRQPLALVMLSYYCVLLKSQERENWFFEGWAAGLMSRIEDSLENSPWGDEITWAREMMKEIKPVDKECPVLKTAAQLSD